MTTRRRVLLIEDDAMVRRLLDGVLRKPGWDVTSAATGLEALDGLAKMRFDAILCDFDLGRGPNGLDILKALPRMNHDTPFVMLTAHATIDRCRDAMLHGAQDFVEKPSTPAQIVSKIERAWDPSVSNSEAAALDNAEWRDAIGDRHVRRALRIIERQFRDPDFSVEALARSMDITPDHLRRLFRKHLGCGPLKQIHRTRIRAVEELLRHSELSIYQIAAECGYRTTTELDEWFDHFNQISPSQWHQRHN